MIKAITSWVQRNRSVRELSSLSDRELADIGIARGDIEALVRGGRMHSDEVASAVGPRQTLSRLGEQTTSAVQSFA
ncbi:MAG TPA: DUF1127 domain-containing protein [Lichenihabitans sp.]|jgi:uncharacterized protein YjiS (DUF1127 family)|nr:DUF1127 domain-containing protein [Lichenihabitans sp.]